MSARAGTTRGRVRTGLLFAVPLAIGVAIGVGWGWAAPIPTSRTFDVDARQFAFEPGILRVNRGDSIELHVRSTDVTHGLYIDGYGIEGKVPPHGELVVRFTADQIGRFALRCSRTCGVFHPFMTGQLVVEPNLLFPGSIGGAIGAAVGAVLYAGRSRGRSG